MGSVIEVDADQPREVVEIVRSVARSCAFLHEDLAGLLPETEEDRDLRSLPEEFEL
jgi:hypothetical protein